MKEILLKLTPKERKKMGIPKTTWFDIKKRLEQGKEIKLRRKTIEKLEKLNEKEADKNGRRK